jgi:hypothetical protein
MEYRRIEDQIQNESVEVFIRSIFEVSDLPSFLRPSLTNNSIFQRLHLLQNDESGQSHRQRRSNPHHRHRQVLRKRHRSLFKHLQASPRRLHLHLPNNRQHRSTNADDHHALHDVLWIRSDTPPKTDWKFDGARAETRGRIPLRQQPTDHELRGSRLLPGKFEGEADDLGEFQQVDGAFEEVLGVPSWNGSRGQFGGEM